MSVRMGLPTTFAGRRSKQRDLMFIRCCPGSVWRGECRPVQFRLHRAVVAPTLVAIAYDAMFGTVTWSAIRTRSGSDAAFILRITCPR